MYIVTSSRRNKTSRKEQDTERLDFRSLSVMGVSVILDARVRLFIVVTP